MYTPSDTECARGKWLANFSWQNQTDVYPEVEIKFPGNPIYQLKGRDISDKELGFL